MVKNRSLNSLGVLIQWWDQWSQPGDGYIFLQLARGLELWSWSFERFIGPYRPAGSLPCRKNNSRWHQDQPIVHDVLPISRLVFAHGLYECCNGWLFGIHSKNLINLKVANDDYFVHFVQMSRGAWLPPKYFLCLWPAGGFTRRSEYGDPQQEFQGIWRFCPCIRCAAAMQRMDNWHNWLGS